MSAIPQEIEPLIASLGDDAPCGPDLEYDPEFQSLEQAGAGTPERQYGDKVFPAEPPDWPTVLEHAQGPFAHLVFIGTIAETQQRGYLASAFAAALDIAIKRGCRQIVTPLLTGGWRIPPVDAVTEMLNVVEKPWYQQQRVELTIVEHDEKRVAII